MKQCTKCGEVKPLIEFHKKKTGKFGVGAHCKICAHVYYTNWIAINRKRHNEVSKKWYEANRERHSKNCKRWQTVNKHQKNKISRKWYALNKDLHLERVKKWRATNRNKDRAISQRAAIKRKLRVPKWAELSAIKHFYANCPPGYVVDHIIPLCGKDVSGLHVLSNLQYLPYKINIAKSNKFDIINLNGGF